ncbi:unnamed protein product [Linum trigynum]|uniref:Uncharacterized protein n=1 Tax=Linum trigynum TaxID=586398 RepID=A0AAV2GW97_9ROSI
MSGFSGSSSLSGFSSPSSSSSFFLSPSSSSSSSGGGSYGSGGGIGVFIGLNWGNMSGLRPGFGLSHSCNAEVQNCNTRKTRETTLPGG